MATTKLSLNTLKLSANKELKAEMFSLKTVCLVIRETIQTNESVKAYFEAIGLDCSTMLNVKFIMGIWRCKNEDGKICRKVKGELKEIAKFSPFAVLTELEAHLVTKEAKKELNKLLAKEQSLIEAEKAEKSNK